MTVPLLDLAPQHDPLEAELREAFERVLKSGRFILGPEVEDFEKSLAGYTQTAHALGMSSGTDALLCALMALDIGPGDEVIVPAFSFFATAGCVARVGATPVFADICPVCFNFNPDLAHDLITPRTKAIIPVHLFGHPADMRSINAFASRYGLRVIEDAAQSLGARYAGTPVGGLSDIGIYSFFPTKNLGCLGDGGALVTNDDPLAEKALWLRNHGMNPRYHHRYVGGNFRLDALQAAFLSVKLPHLDSYAQARAENAAAYRERLLELPGVVASRQEDCCCPLRERVERENEMGARIVLPVAYDHCDAVWNQYTIRVRGGARAKLRKFLAERQIATEIYYPITLDQQECFAHFAAADAPPVVVSHLYANQVLSLPVYAGLSTEQIDEVCTAIGDFLEG